MNRREQLKDVVERIDKSAPDDSKLDLIIKELEDSGIRSRMHVGESEEFFYEDIDTRVPEWLMGQFIDGFYLQSFLAYNSAMNLSMSYLEGNYPKQKGGN